MNTVYPYGLYNQSTMFKSKIGASIPKKIRRTKRTLSNAEIARENQIKNLKDLIDKNPDVAKIVEDVNSGKKNVEDAAQKIIDTIA